MDVICVFVVLKMCMVYNNDVTACAYLYTLCFKIYLVSVRLSERSQFFRRSSELNFEDSLGRFCKKAARNISC